MGGCKYKKYNNYDKLSDLHPPSKYNIYNMTDLQRENECLICFYGKTNDIKMSISFNLELYMYLYKTV